MRLFIIRHGKAERTAPTGRDADRLLAPRGQEQARMVSEDASGIGEPDSPASPLQKGRAGFLLQHRQLLGDR